MFKLWGKEDRQPTAVLPPLCIKALFYFLARSASAKWPFRSSITAMAIAM